MGACKNDGNFEARVTDVTLIEHRFNKAPGAMEFRLGFVDAQNDTGFAYLDLSQDLVTGGVNKGMTRAQDTLANLKTLGVDISTSLANATALVGKVIPLRGKAKLNDDGSVSYFSFFLNLWADKVIDMATVQPSALFGNQPQQAVAGQGVPPQQAVIQAGNLFANPVNGGQANATANPFQQ